MDTNGEMFAVDFLPLSELAGLPIKANSVVKTYNPDGSNGVDLECRMSLLEFLDAIYWEISFWGGPKERDGVAAEILEMTNEWKEEGE